MSGFIINLLWILFFFVYGNNFEKWPLPKKCGETRYEFKGMTRETRIVQGQEACIGQFPWMVRLGYKFLGRSEMACGAALISKFYVVTAAHCEGCNVAIFGITFVDHEEDCDSNGCAPKPQEISIKRYMTHLEYSKYRMDHDYALVELDDPVKFNDFVQPICFPPEQVPHEDLQSEPLYIAGWGVMNTTSDNPLPTRLMYIVAPLLEQDPCNAIYKSKLLPQSQMCIGYSSGPDSCNGDSGGPVFRIMDSKAYLVGVVSYGLVNCGAGPAVYTDASYFAEWTLERITKT